MSNWLLFEDGRSIGRTGPEGGVILYDEENPAGARITLKRSSGFVAVSANIYGWFDHTRFFSTVTEAQREYRAMRGAVSSILTVISEAGSKEIKVWEAISEFVRRFP